MHMGVAPLRTVVVSRLLGAGMALVVVCSSIAAVAGQQGDTGSPSSQPTVQADRPGQAAPQGNVGQIDTRSGGAPASSPQGDTPPGMQPIPSAPDRTSPPK
jgi:hypothetical protein